MAPLVCSVHSIVGLDFAGAATVGWHSTQFPPFFIFGAFLSGFAMVLILIIPLRRLLRLERYITGRHIDVLGRLMLTSSLFVFYAYGMDAFSVFYGGDAAERGEFIERVTGYYAAIFWATILFNIALPQLLWWPRLRLNQTVVLLISLGIIIGMWCERFMIVVVSLHHTHLPSSWGVFHRHCLGLADFGGHRRAVLHRYPAGGTRAAGHRHVRDARTRRAAAALMAGLLLAFASEPELRMALARLRTASLGEIETYTPKPLQAGPSIVPSLVLLGGVLGAVASFCLQSYATTIAYPLNIGGRPDLSWPSFIPIAFENGVLVAVLAGFGGYLAVNRLPRLYDPVDECAALRRAMRDHWCLTIRTERPEQVRALLCRRAAARHRGAAMTRRAAGMLALLVLIGSCDDMTEQDKGKAYSRAAGSVHEAQDAVPWHDATLPAPAADARASRARPAAVSHLLHALPLGTGRRQRDGGAARLSASAVVSQRSSAPGLDAAFL